jgi:predicted dehydrogenase
MLNAALIGVGRWGQILASSVQGKSENIRFSAGVTRTKAKAADYCRENGIDLRDDYADILNDPEIDAVVLATPHTQHEEQIVRAAEAGKHVFTEKPFTLTRASAERAVAACQKAGVTVALGHNRRFMKNTEKLKEFVEAGELGTLMHIDGNQSTDMGRMADTWRDSREDSPAGGMTSLGIHALDCMIHLGGPIAELDCYSIRRAIGYDIDDTTSALVRFAAGMTGTITTLAATAKIWHIRVAGSEGWAELRDQQHLTICRRNGEEEVLTLPCDPYPHADSMAAELEEFALAATGRATYRIWTDEMINGVACLEAMTKSAETGQRVQIAV